MPLIAGEQTLRVTGRDAAGREAFATVEVTRDARRRRRSASPRRLITLTSAAARRHVHRQRHVRRAPTARRVDVNGIAATVSGATFTRRPFRSSRFGRHHAGRRARHRAGRRERLRHGRRHPARRRAESPRSPSPRRTPSKSIPARSLLVLFSAPMDRTSLGCPGLGGASVSKTASGSAITGTLFSTRTCSPSRPPRCSRAARATRMRRHHRGEGSRRLRARSGVHQHVHRRHERAVHAARRSTPSPARSAASHSTSTARATPGARVRLESGTHRHHRRRRRRTASSASRSRSAASPAIAIVRVRTVGRRRQPFARRGAQLRVDCAGPRSCAAAFDRDTQRAHHRTSPSRMLASTVTQRVHPPDALRRSLRVGNVRHVGERRHGHAGRGSRQQDFTLERHHRRHATPSAIAWSRRTRRPSTVGSERAAAGDGSGFISGEVYDATTGRPLAGASITVEVAGTPFTTSTDARGRYVLRLPEGAHTIPASRTGYTTVWRQILVPAGAGVVPIDIRLTNRGDAKTSTGAALSLTHGGDTAITRATELTIPAGAWPAARASRSPPPARSRSPACSRSAGRRSRRPRSPSTVRCPIT